MHINHDIQTRNTKNYIAMGKALAQLAEKQRSTLVSGDQGAISYFSNWKSIDPVGLTNTFVAANQKMDNPEPIIDYIINSDPDLIVIRKRMLGGYYFSHSRIADLGGLLMENSKIRDSFVLADSTRDEECDHIDYFVNKNSKNAHEITEVVRYQARKIRRGDRCV